LEKAGLAPASLFAFEPGCCLLPPSRDGFRLKTLRDPTNR
jgi:hypothetical protein